MTAIWAARLRLAVRLGISPAEFWRLSVAEWRALTEAAPADPGMGRAALSDLMTQFPDRTHG